MSDQETHERVMRIIAANERWLREQVWWRRIPRRMVERMRVLLHWGTR